MPNRLAKILTLLTTVLLSFSITAYAKLNIGVTLHPYYSYVANIVKDRATVTPVVPEGFNPHAFEPRAQDIKKINNFDVIVLNDIGHDLFARKMIAASENKQVPLILANQDVPLLSSMGLDADNREGVVNPHTFISISASMIQVNTIARALAKLDPANADFYLQNARSYNKRLRKLRSDALAKIRNSGKINLKVATEHGAYDYLFREFGLSVGAVIEPGHGIEPSPAQLKKVAELFKQQHITILFAEKDNPNPYTKTIARETGVQLAYLTHISHGPYTPEAFEQGMQYNLAQITQAILHAAANPSTGQTRE